MIIQCGVLFLFLALGELVEWLTGTGVPSSIIGMLLLALSLKCGIVKLNMVEKFADFLVHNIGFFFVPAGVGLMRCLGIISEQWLPIVGATIGSTVIIIAVTGWTHQITRKTVGHGLLH
ncbi:MAG: CidA/LrgA family protein [Muribaculaceae bacterium]|nr:CidA/LrgA family protein [Muribaculaceae bacterium]